MNPAILAFLLLGHALGDFVFQSDALVRRKREPHRRAAALRDHALILALCHLGAALPLLHFGSLLVLLGLVAVHAIIDAIKIQVEARVEARVGRALPCFLLDQAAHLLTLIVVARYWKPLVSLAGLRDSPWLDLGTRSFLALAAAALVLQAVILAWRAGSFLVALVLAACKIVPEPRPDDGPALGRVIGVLERLVILTLVLVQAWAGIGLILAAKSIARFKELEDRRFGEYYLVGTLTSVLIALLVGLGTSGLLSLLSP